MNKNETVEIRPAFSLDYGRARNLLDGASLLAGPHDSTGPLGGLGLAGYVMDSSVNLRTLLVYADREEEARLLLEQHGIILADGGTVIDISEMNCPSCGAVLPSHRITGDINQCEGCGTSFTWIDVTA